MKLILILLSLFVMPLISCEKGCKEKIKEDCACTQQYDPVCGCNKKTYGNACTAECSGITEYSKGECI